MGEINKILCERQYNTKKKISNFCHEIIKYFYNKICSIYTSIFYFYIEDCEKSNCSLIKNNVRSLIQKH